MTEFGDGSYRLAEAAGVSENGQTIVGTDIGQNAFRWTSQPGVAPTRRDGAAALYPYYAEGSVANGVSADGTAFVGWKQARGADPKAFRWTARDGLVTLPTPAGFPISEATRVSADGSVVVGQFATAGWPPKYAGHAFRWTASEGMTPLRAPPGGDYSWSNDLSADGSLIVGGSGIIVNGWMPLTPFIWDPVHGMRNLADLLRDLDLDANALLDTEATSISADGLTIVGGNEYPGTGWIVTIPESGALSWSALAASLLRRRRDTGK
jgi:uncharacterized membrane protein